MRVWSSVKRYRTSPVISVLILAQNGAIMGIVLTGNGLPFSSINSSPSDTIPLEVTYINNIIIKEAGHFMHV